MTRIHTVIAAATLMAALTGSAYAQSTSGAADTVGRPTGGTQIQSIDKDAKMMDKSAMDKKMEMDNMKTEGATTGQAPTPGNPSLPDASDGHK